jgi:hypothetical protein
MRGATPPGPHALLKNSKSSMIQKYHISCGLAMPFAEYSRKKKAKNANAVRNLFWRTPCLPCGAAMPFAKRALKRNASDLETVRNLFSRNIEK